MPQLGFSHEELAKLGQRNVLALKTIHGKAMNRYVQNKASP
jgi:hypothetical protein